MATEKKTKAILGPQSDPKASRDSAACLSAAQRVVTFSATIREFGLDAATLIDPTCGSGHFLLGAFERPLDHRLRVRPGVDVREAAKRVLDASTASTSSPASA